MLIICGKKQQKLNFMMFFSSIFTLFEIKI